MRLLQEIRLAQQTLSDMAAHGMSAEVRAGTPAITDFVASLASAWKDGEARPTHRKQPKAKHGWKTRVDPVADAWLVLIRYETKPSSSSELPNP